MAVVGGGGTKTSVCQLRGEGRIPGRGNSGGGGQMRNRGSVGDEPGGWGRETWQRLSWIGSIGFMTGGRGQ
jgi:hypothetical protein